MKKEPKTTPNLEKLEKAEQAAALEMTISAGFHFRLDLLFDEINHFSEHGKPIPKALLKDWNSECYETGRYGLMSELRFVSGRKADQAAAIWAEAKAEIVKAKGGKNEA